MFIKKKNYGSITSSKLKFLSGGVVVDGQAILGYEQAIELKNKAQQKKNQNPTKPW